MNSFAENMRQMRDRLKSAGARLRDIAQRRGEAATMPQRNASGLRGLLGAWRGRAQEPAQPRTEEAGEPAWRLAAGDIRKRWTAWRGAKRQTAGPMADERAEPVLPWPQQGAAPSSPLRAEPRYRPSEAEPRRWGVRAAKIAAAALLVFLALPYALAPLYRFVDPPFSALMARQALSGVGLRHAWVDLNEMSPALPTAVIVAEDAGFCRHWGVDWNAVGEAMEDAEDGERVRGASTLPMQTAKNLFLWNGASYVRKALELPLAYYLSAIWPKRRLLEIYLNVAEWGPGVFGAEAAAREHFGKSASALSSREAALLAAVLPNPITRDAGRPSGGTARLAERIQQRVGREGQAASCVLGARDRL